jgi:hypothetical protein
MGCRMGQRDELRQKSSNTHTNRQVAALARLIARSGKRNRTVSLVDSCMRRIINAKFNSLLTP